MTDQTEELRAELRAAEFRADQAEYELEVRAKYTAAEMAEHLKNGKAMANANGDPSYPVVDLDDIKKAIKAVGRGSADHDDIRKHIIDGAKALGADAEALIPDNWNADGSLKDDDTEENSGPGPGEVRANEDDTKECPTCGGDGKILANKRQCPDCDGTGKVASDFEAKSATVPVATYIDQMTAEVTRSDREPGHRDAPATPEEREELAEVRLYIADVHDELAALDENSVRTALAFMAPEMRAALMSYGDIENAVEDAIKGVYSDGNGYCDLWVMDSGDGWVVFCSYVDPPGCGDWKVTFTLEDDDTVTFTSEPIPVARVTTYEQIPAPSAPKLTAVEAKADKVLTTVYRSLMTVTDDEARAAEFFGYDERTQAGLLVLHEAETAEVEVTEEDRAAADAARTRALLTGDRLRMRESRFNRAGDGKFGNVPTVAAGAHKVGDKVTAPNATTGTADAAKVTAVAGNKVTVQHADGSKSTHAPHEVTPVAS